MSQAWKPRVGDDWSSLDPQIRELHEQGFSARSIVREMMKPERGSHATCHRRVINRLRAMGLMKPRSHVRSCSICGMMFIHKHHAAKFCNDCGPTPFYRHICIAYGIGKSTYDLLMKACEGRCVMCTELFTDERPPVIDHDHNDGRVRGFLHRTCNIQLAHIEDFERLRRTLNHAGKLHWLQGGVTPSLTH